MIATMRLRGGTDRRLSGMAANTARHRFCPPCAVTGNKSFRA